MSSVSGQYAIVGLGECDVGKRPDTTARALLLEAAIRAIQDSGLEKHAVDGLITRPPRSEPQFNYSAVLAGHLGIQPRYILDVGHGGASSAFMVLNAVAALAAGYCTAVLCVNGDNQTGRFRSRGRFTEWSEDFEVPYGLIGGPPWFALAAQRHMHEYGTTSRQLGAIAVACRKHASLNPNAIFHTPFTLEEHEDSRMVCDPFHLLDCCPRSDAAGAVIVTSAERARDLANPPAYLLGLGQFNAYNEMHNAPSLTTVASRQASQRAYQMAGLGPEDVDVAELYDCFTYTALVTLEDYGFCAKGEGGAFVEGGRVELGGQLPLNTSGGLLSQGHASGFLHITEATRQMRGQAGPRQIPGAEVAIVSGSTLNMNCCLLLGTKPS